MTWLGTEQGNRTPSQDYASNNGKFCALLLPEKLSDELKEHLQVEEDDNPIIVML